MKQTNNSIFQNPVSFFTLAVFIFLGAASPALCGGYDNALKDVKGVKAVFNYSQGSPKKSNILFWAVQNAYEDKAVNSLKKKPKFAIVFHGPSVKLISSDRSSFPEKEFAELEKFQATIRQLKKDGVKLEICLYAAKVMGVNPATVMPEIDHVGNGVVSVLGYQAQGYSVFTLP